MSFEKSHFYASGFLDGERAASDEKAALEGGNKKHPGRGVGLVGLYKSL